MSGPKIVVFAYNFPHRKTQDFLHRLFVERCNVVGVLAADPVQLNIPAPALRMKPRYGGLVHPKTISDAYKWPYDVVDHRGSETVGLLREMGAELGIIAGARILPAQVIEAVPKGIINFHPAVLPDGRGLDALPWAVVENRPIGVTAHFIDSKVDAGRIILVREANLNEDDTLMDVSMRLQDMQAEMITEVLSLIAARNDFAPVGAGKLHRKMPAVF